MVILKNQDQIHSSDDLTLEIASELHGEYDMDWIVQKKDGKEISRHNATSVQSIVWE